MEIPLLGRAALLPRSTLSPGFKQVSRVRFSFASRFCLSLSHAWAVLPQSTAPLAQQYIEVFTIPTRVLRRRPRPRAVDDGTFVAAVRSCPGWNGAPPRVEHASSTCCAAPMEQDVAGERATALLLRCALDAPRHPVSLRNKPGAKSRNDDSFAQEP